jgi:Zn-dependent M28 family amino/carboxypeptidase
VRSRLQLVRFAFCAILLIAATATATAPSPGHFGPTDAITIAGLQRHLRFIASDALEGRDALSPGFRAAAEYVAASLDRIGATPAGDGGTFFQHVGIRRTRVDGEHASVAVGDTEFKYGEDYLVPTPGDATGPLTFVGQGYRVSSRHLDPFAGLDVHNQVLIVAQPAPDVGELTHGTDYTTPADNARVLGATAVVTVASFQRLAAWSRMREAEARGSVDVDRLAEKDPVVPGIIAGPRLTAVLFRGEREDASKIVARAASGDAYAPFALKATKTIRIHAPATVKLEDTENVIAVVEGSDPVLKHEFVALGAHLDHIGKDEHPATPKSGNRAADVIYNGADDDGSGVVALLEMAEAVAAAPRPKRSLLFVWHTGEEYGSWGARYFTAFPTVPLDHIVAQLNVDMIGRSRADGDKSPEDAVLTGPNEVYIVGSRRLSQDLGDTCDRVDRAFLNLALNYKYDAPDDPERIYERSDHYEYAQKGIPVAFFFTGLHADYHRVTDEIGRIDFDKLQKVARTVLATAWTLANAPDRPHLDHDATR